MRPPLAVALLVAGVPVLIGHDFILTGERGLWSGLPAAAIVAAALALERSGIAWRARWIQLLGGASYVLYLVHPFLLSIATKLAGRAGALANPGLAIAASLVTLIVIGVAALLGHVLVERPLGVLLRRLAGHRPSRVDRADFSPPDAEAAPLRA